MLNCQNTQWIYWVSEDDWRGLSGAIVVVLSFVTVEWYWLLP